MDEGKQNHVKISINHYEKTSSQAFLLLQKLQKFIPFLIEILILCNGQNM